MPLPTYRRTATQTAKDLAATYGLISDRMLEDFRSRVMKSGGHEWITGGNVDALANYNYAAEINASLKSMAIDLEATAPEIAAHLADQIRATISPQMDSFLERVLSGAPAGYVRPALRLVEMAPSYIRKGSLLDEKIYQIMQFRKGPPPIHHVLLERTRAEMQAMIGSGKSWADLVLGVQENCFGVSWRTEGTHPALPDKMGRIADPDYGKRRGYSTPDNPRGVLSDVERLVRTELREQDSAEKSAIIETWRDEGLAIGYRIAFSDGACDRCIEAFGDGEIYYADVGDGGPLPPAHPNCDCLVVGVIWNVQ